MIVRTCCTIAVVSAVALVCVVRAEEKKSANTEAAQALAKIKALSGDWKVVKGPDEHGQHGGTVSYRVTAGGSAVVETLFGGTDHEMVTVYYLDGNDLALTHYCVLGNRPHMRAEPESNPNKIVFKCTKAENAAIWNDDHMHQATFQFVDADHLKTDWVLYHEGQPQGSHSFELRRQK